MAPEEHTQAVSLSATPRVCRRAVAPDRRRRVIWGLLYGCREPRRRGPRRAEDASRYIADWHHPYLMKVAVAVLLLSATDALLTLELIKLGAHEVNVFMLGLIHGDLSRFVGVKMALTGLGVTYLVLRSSATVFGRIPVYRLLQGVLVAYGMLILYELGLLYYALSF